MSRKLLVLAFGGMLIAAPLAVTPGWLSAEERGEVKIAATALGVPGAPAYRVPEHSLTAARRDQPPSASLEPPLMACRVRQPTACRERQPTACRERPPTVSRVRPPTVSREPPPTACRVPQPMVSRDTRCGACRVPPPMASRDTRCGACRERQPTACKERPLTGWWSGSRRSSAARPVPAERRSRRLAGRGAAAGLVHGRADQLCRDCGGERPGRPEGRRDRKHGNRLPGDQRHRRQSSCRRRARGQLNPQDGAAREAPSPIRDE